MILLLSTVFKSNIRTIVWDWFLFEYWAGFAAKTEVEVEPEVNKEISLLFFFSFLNFFRRKK